MGPQKMLTLWSSRPCWDCFYWFFRLWDWLLVKFGDYSHWLQKYVVNEQNWEEIKSCLVDTEFCQHLPTSKSPDFHKYNLSANQLVWMVVTHGKHFFFYIQFISYFFNFRNPFIQKKKRKMVRLSNFIIALLNCVTLVASLAAIGLSIWLHINDSATLCLKVLQKPLLIVGVCLLVVSVLGLVGSLCQVSFILYIYLFFLFLLIVGLLCFTVFSILVTNKNVSKALSGRGYKEIKTGDYTKWLQKYVVKEENWEEIKSCLVDSKFCQRLPSGKGADFYKYSLSATQSSCCKPPTYCGLEFHNATSWTMPKTGPVVADNDCKIWSNGQTELCFNCQSCKTAFLDNIKKDWKQLSLVNFGFFLLVLFVYCVGCCALRNNKSKGYLGVTKVTQTHPTRQDSLLPDRLTRPIHNFNPYFFYFHR
ncbi:tetraspanin-8 [Lycium barbarum]|uniref:tetraspanin-8 n=1 Tax=Lycium barbarum TaxID=112863 RepID=UPI00293EDCDB|nr:tetraspanin-8 [Lycium barbarum]